MKKALFIIALSFLFVMCKSTKTTTTSTSAITEAKPTKENFIYSDGFKAATPAQTAALLKSLDATAANYSVLVLTKNFHGEEVVVTNGSKQVYKGYALSNGGSGIAEKIRIDNTADTKIYDSYSKKEIVIESSDAKKYKFVHVAKDTSKKVPFVVVCSNKVKALE